MLHPTRPESITSMQRWRLRPAQLAVRADAVFELLLGLLLVLSPVTGLLAAFHLPAPISTPIVVGFGLALLPVALALWLIGGVEARSRRLLALLASVNGLTALLACLWVVLARSDFGGPGAGAVLMVAAGLAILAALEGWLTR